MMQIRLFCVIAAAFLLVACGGGGSQSTNMQSQVNAQDLPILPPSDSRTYENIRAADPLPSFRAVQFPALSKFDYLRTPANGLDLDMTVYNAPNADIPDDLIPTANRAFKLWSRRIDGIPHGGVIHQFADLHREPGRDGKVRIDFVAGYTQETGCEHACSNHYGDNRLLPQDRSDYNPVFVLAQDFFYQHINDDKVSVNGFRVLTHEFGHIFDYKAPSGQGAIDRGVYQRFHRNCSTEGIMCQHWQDGTPIIPTDQDFDGIRHHYDLKPDSNFEEFGIWAAVRQADSDLNEFGVKVTRTLIVDPVNRFTQEAANDFIEDRIRIETMIDGTASSGPVTGMGTATWNGDLIAVDKIYFQPVLGDASLSMDLSNVDRLEARFTDMQRTDDAGMRHDIADTAYTLMKSGSTYVNDQGTIDANFYAVGTDDIGAVAGRMDDATRSLMGVYGAIRN